jgi:hypothetical protein
MGAIGFGTCPYKVMQGTSTIGHNSRTCLPLARMQFCHCPYIPITSRCTSHGMGSSDIFSFKCSREEHRSDKATYGWLYTFSSNLIHTHLQVDNFIWCTQWHCKSCKPYATVPPPGKNRMSLSWIKCIVGHLLNNTLFPIPREKLNFQNAIN